MSGHEERVDTEVLVIGGGPVGLSLATELARHGIGTVLIDERDGTVNTPRMNFVNVRTMEFCRRWGITETVREAGHPTDFHPNVRWVTAITGYEVARMEHPPLHEQPTTLVSPEYDCMISQLWFDPILLAHARTLPGLRLVHRCRLESFAETDQGIEAEATDIETGRTMTIGARYLVGCDGAGSTVREQLGIALSGLPTMQENYHVYFDSTELLEIFERNLGHTWFLHLLGPGRMWGMIMSVDWRGKWRFTMRPPPEDRSIVPDLLRKAVGVDFDFTMLNESYWASPKLVADTFRKGCAFLAGDAAHQLNPTGGFGMNTGVGDAVDLAWKLAAVLRGWGGPALLDSYDAERRPIAARNVEEATLNLRRQQRLEPGDAIDQDIPEGARQREAFRQTLLKSQYMDQYDTDGVALGYRYDGSPVICPDGSPPPPDGAHEYVPSARPGHRAPHAWLAPGRSTLDLFGAGLTLLSFGGEEGQAEAFAEAARERAVPLAIVPIADAAIAALYERPLVLVRPDGHVAWRGGSADAGAVLDRVTGH